MIPDYIKKEAKKEIARRSLFDYCQLMNPQFYKNNRIYLKEMCDKIQEFINQEDKKFLVINLPPRHGKSFTSQNTVEWLFGSNPSLKVMTGSYNETLSGQFAKQVRDTIQNIKVDDKLVYSDIFPKTRVKYGEASASMWSLEGSSQKNYLATSPTGTATGFGCFPKGTKIYTNKGTMLIEELYNDKNDIRVLSYSLKDDIIRLNKIKAKRRLKSNENIKITTNTGRTVVATRDHIFYTKEDGYIRADKIKIGRTIKTSTNMFKMREMWQNISEKNIRVKKGNKKRVSALLLFEKVFMPNKCKKTKKRLLLQKMWQKITEVWYKILFKRMQTFVLKGTRKNNVSDMQKAISTEVAQNYILFDELQKQSTFNKNDRNRKFPLQKWFKLFKGIYRYKTKGIRKRQSQVPNMWEIRSSNEKQEIWYNNEFKSPSHKRKYKRQFIEKFNNFMSKLSYKITQDEKIVNIEYIDEEMEVYDIQVDRDENFYANGILVHNCEIMIIDDLIKNSEEAYNENTLDKQWEWFNNTMLSRLEGNWKVIIIMTRWAERDLAGRVIDTFGDLVEVIKYKAIQEDGSMLCDEILSKQDFEIKIKEMNEDIVQANYNQEPIDVKGRLYGEFKVYNELPKFNQIYAYTDTADKGEDFLVTIVYGIINNEVYVIDIQYDDRSMEITEEETTDILYKNDVNIADIESNNGGRGFARNVERRLKEKYNSNKTIIRPFTQTGNKEARILTSATWVSEHFYMPFNWKNKYREAYKSISTYQKKGKNKHDDIQDVMAGIYERVANKPRLEFGYRNII